MNPPCTMYKYTDVKETNENVKTSRNVWTKRRPKFIVGTWEAYFVCASNIGLAMCWYVVCYYPEMCLCVCVMVVNTKIIPMNFQLASIVWVSGSVCASFFQFQLELFFLLYSSLFTIHVCIQMHVERIILFIWENQFVKHLRTPWYNRNRYIAKTTIKIEKKNEEIRLKENEKEW